jgi:hypothetical protein
MMSKEHLSYPGSVRSVAGRGYDCSCWVMRLTGSQTDQPGSSRIGCQPRVMNARHALTV